MNYKLKSNMKIVICASSKFIDEINFWKQKLVNDGHVVIKYPEKIEGDFLTGYQKEFTDHYKRITECDALFILNIKKNNIEGYIGPGVYAEIAFAVGLKRSQNKQIKIICVNPTPNNLPHSEELKFWESLGW